MFSNKCEICVTDKSKCIECKDNPIYANVPKWSQFQEYIPTCPQGYCDCVYDPAYIKFYHPEWYEKQYEDMTPEEVAKKHCDKEDKYCYDDEDK